jgi:hypothetical protein
MTNPHIIIDTAHPIETIKYSFAQLPFGKIIIATTQYGICSIAFYTSSQQAVDELKRQFHDSSVQEGKLDQKLISYLQHTQDSNISIRLHLCATEFQLQVWKALLTIPFGHMFHIFYFLAYSCHYFFIISPSGAFDYRICELFIV